MFKAIIQKYKFPLLISLVLSLVILALSLPKSFFGVLLAILGSVLGVFVLDLDYLFYSFVIDPKHYFSVNVKKFIANKSFGSAFAYIENHKTELRNLPLHSAMFFLMAGVTAIFILVSEQFILVKALVLSIYLQSFFEQLKDFFAEKEIYQWFWMLKVKPSLTAIKIYFLLSGLFFIFLLSFV